MTGLDVCNASVYDGATACAEALLMGARINKQNKVLISDINTKHFLNLQGEELHLGYLNGKSASIKTYAELFSDENKNITANIDINTFLPPPAPADALVVNIVTNNIATNPINNHGSKLVKSKLLSIGATCNASNPNSLISSSE